MNANNFFDNFKSLNLGNFKELEAILKRYPQPVVGFTAATLVTWNQIYNYSYFFPDLDSLLISFEVDSSDRRQFMQPIGSFTPEIAAKLIDYAKHANYPIKIYGVSTEFISKFPEFISHFEIQENRDGANYIYKTSDLAHLAAGKYSKKRNLLNQASRIYSWQVEKLTTANINCCCGIFEEVFKEPGFEMKGSLANETTVLKFVLQNFSVLEQHGLIIRMEGRPVAFSIFEELNPQTVVVHFEKALHSIKGIFQVINKETALVVESLGYDYINREEDVGDEGLRKSKLSYYPHEVRQSNILVFKN